jgi:hypothetical protein
LYLTDSPEYRLASTGAVLNVAGAGGALVIAEIAFPPLGYCLIAEGCGNRAEHNGLCEVTHFSRYGLLDVRTLYLRLPLRRPAGPLPLQYRR